MEENGDNRVIRVTRLINGENVIYERIKDEVSDDRVWIDPLILNTEHDPETGKAYLRFALYVEYADIREIQPPPDSARLCTYEPAPEVIQARDQFLGNYRFERGHQEAKKRNGGPKWDTSSKITPLH